MKRLASVALLSVILLFSFACGGGGGGGGGDKKTGPDEKIISVKVIEDYGYTALFEIKMDFSSLLAGTKFVNGQSAPNQAWKDYAVEDPGTLKIVWTKGEYFEFSYGTESGNTRTWVNPTGKYIYPENASALDKHFRIKLGEVQFCAEKNVDDALIVAVHKLSANKWRVYLDFTRLPIVNYKKLFVRGQSGPDSAWVEYTVTDAHPCYSFDVTWPQGSTLPFEFSYGVVKANDKEEWIDPTFSKFVYKDHLIVDFRNY